MSLHDSIKEICDGLRSARLTERKKNADALKSFLTRNAVPSLLTENSLNKRGYTWNDLFDDINDYIMKELEKYETSKTFQSAIEPLCTSLLHLCVAGSNKGRTYIKCEKITEACLNILKDNRLAKAIGDSYLSLLYKYVLPCEHYCQRITPSTWEELLDVSVVACRTNHSKLDNFTKLRLLLLVINSGRYNCQFVIPLRDSLSNLKKLFLEVPHDKKAQEVIVEITISLLETLSSEYRLSMCHFVESVLPSVLRLYDQIQDPKKKSLIFTLLHASMVLHHPRGRLRSQEGSLAGNWDVWNKHIYGMLEIINMEVTCLQKQCRQNVNAHQQNKSFYCLSASVYFQTFNQLDTSEYDQGSSTKRQKLTNNKIKVFGDLIDELQQNHIPWLGIVQVFVKDYYHYILDHDYSKLVNVIEMLITKNNNISDWDILEDLALLVIEHFPSSQGKTHVDDNNVLITLWNSCVRNCAYLNSSHEVLHTIIQYLLKYVVQDYQNVKPLMKLYLDCGMPVNDSSIKTLCFLFQKFFIKLNYEDIRIKCFTWFIQGGVKSVSVKQIQALTLQLLGVENVNSVLEREASVDSSLFHTLFHSTEDCILFSEFENKNPKYAPAREHKLDYIDINIAMDKYMKEYYTTYLQKNLERLKDNDIELIIFMKFIEIIVSYIDVLIKYGGNSIGPVEETTLYGLLKTALKEIFFKLQPILGSNAQVGIKIKYLQLVRELLESDVSALLSTEIRLSIDDRFFHCLNNIIYTEIKTDDQDVVRDEDDELVDAVALKHNCIYIFAVFCIKTSSYRAELLDLIFDPKTYNFTFDVNCALQCMEILNSPEVDQPPLGSMFTLMAHMCRCLYRDSIASYHILKILIKMLDIIWLQDSTTKQNCYIMIRSYLQRCEKLFYPPNVAALIYECGAKIFTLDRRHNDSIDSIFEKALIERTKGDIHSVRLYCCYLLSTMINYFSEEDIDALCTSTNDLFLINVPSRQEFVLKDELANRTSTALHMFLAIALEKQSSSQEIVNKIICFQKEKSINQQLIKKVLNKVVTAIGVNDVESYLDTNVLCFLHFWFTNKYNLEDLPFHLFGHDTLDEFLEKHKNWLITSYMLWCKKGNIKEINFSEDLKINEPLENILEVCFCNIISLCLPYMVVEKYKINAGSQLSTNFIQHTEHSKEIFQLTGQILPSEKWTNLFVENLSRLLLLTTVHLSDQTETQNSFQIKLPKNITSFYYPKTVYMGILNFMADLTDGDIMAYLCDNQPLGIYRVMCCMWDNVANENVFELKALAIHAYITFIENIPVGHASDAFVWNFICCTFGHAIKECCDKEVFTVLAKGLKVLLDMLLPKLASFIVQKPLSRLLSILLMKKEEKYSIECRELLGCLISNIKSYLNTNEDVIDYISSMSQNVPTHEVCPSMSTFLEKLRTFKLTMFHPSYETLLDMRQFLKTNKRHVRVLRTDLEQTIFSEDCGKSILHQTINSLATIITSATNNKTIIEASNCLSELETYDLKSLVTVPSNETQEALSFNPKLCFAITCVKSLTENLFDRNSKLTNQIAETLSTVLKHFEDIDVLGMEELEKLTIKSLSPIVNTAPLDIRLNHKAFKNYHSTCLKGVFVNAFTKDWLPNGKENHCDWLKRVTSCMLGLIEWGTDCIINVQQVCVSKANICEDMLPALVGLLIYCSTEQQIQVIGEQINMFFNHVWEETFNNIENGVSARQTIVHKTSHLDHYQKCVVQYMLSIVDFIRLQRSYYKSRPNRTAESLNYLKLQYDKVAWAATVADQNLAAIYYGELWAVSQNNGVPPSTPERTTNLNGGENVQQIFRKCYVSIGEMDAIDGCGTAHLTSEDEKRKHLINTGQFSDALLLHDIALSCTATQTQSNCDLQCGVVRSLHKSGMYHLALQYMNSLPQSDYFDDIRYECLSFLGDWSGFVDIRALREKSEHVDTNAQSLLKALHYACLKDCLNANITPNSEYKMTELIDSAKRTTAKLCQNLNMKNCQSVYTIVSKLRLFTDMEDYFDVRSAKTSMETVLDNWNINNLPPYNDFKHLEALVSQRVLMLEHASNSYKEFSNEINSLQIQYARLGLSNNKIQMVQRLLSLMKESKPLAEVAFLESEISWAKGHKDIALSLLRNIVTHETANVTMRAISSRQYGLWMAESKHENARDIINKYLLKSLAVLKGNDHVETRIKVYYDIAKFADSEYKQVVLYMNSTVFENKVKCLESLRGTTTSLKSNRHPLSRDEKKALLVNDRFRELDEAEIANTKAEKESFLQLAMRYYLLSLKYSEENNLSVFRVISLWLDNPEFEFEDEQSNNYVDSLRSIPSRKFIMVLPQLAPHLTTQTSSFVKNLTEIIRRCAAEHPHHTLPILFSLKNSDKDKVIMNAGGAVGGGATKARVQEPRVVAADALIQDLEKHNKDLGLIISQMGRMCDAIISVANYKPTSKESKQSIPSAELIHKLKNLDAICVPTVSMPVSRDNKYPNLPALHSFEKYFELVGGINYPKKITCTDTSGKKRILLIKGQDDLRQDAVMQQVFNIVNNLLEKDPVTSRNKLRIRTYKVVPMSRQSGVLEWCVGTIPLGVYLIGVGNAGAHARYRPQDISCSVARKKITECHETRKSNKEKLIVFTNILRDFKPVFHYFFTEHYLNPVSWYERRLAYTTSVATSSMVGYVLGLGDRHVQNILIDKRTGEVIHIDFGIAFDQGKTLPTPETVPFRLTQDIVAGFGSSGVEGVFRRSCEKTMQLLHDSQEILLTILEVLLCDPLYTWTLAAGPLEPGRGASARNSNNQCATSSDSGLAKRALLTVSSKLTGTEGGLAGGVAVAGQVARLLQTATDPANLSRLFSGWQPYL